METVRTSFIIFIFVVLCLSIMFWGLKRLISSVEEMLKSNNNNLENEIIDLKNRLDRIEKMKE
ncbi:hypothetical protein ACQKGD_21250 [Peribacillus frigoritolerans]|uniref:hypothetical protein n=1 Tax=Peribacillus frigoritolerans TaxID=450367 RepID=UPI0007BFBFB1|nr:hypothetical protein [Peribacillus frigoritolerans]USK67055.1 hypothetical protein LIT26_10795 [Peribacillus frigoritolerans]